MIVVYMTRCGNKQQWGGLGKAAVCAFCLPLSHCSTGSEQEGPEAGSTGEGVCHGARAGLVDL